MRTKLCDILEIEKPIIQGGMAWISDSTLAAAVSEAGGLGVISAMNMDAKYLREEIRKLRSITNKPFGVNIMLMSPFVDEVAELIIEENVPVVTTGAGNPAKYMKGWKSAGIKILPVVPSTAMAKLMERYGATCVIAEGGESGGHVGEITSMVLIPQICDSVSIPVIGAGGICDGRGFIATLALGAIGVQMGTRFLSAFECKIHKNYKERVLKAKDIDTIATGRRLGHPVRSIKTSFSREFAKLEYNMEFSNEELENLGSGALRRAVVDGDLEKGCFMAGQVAAMVKKEQSVKDIIEDIMIEADRLVEGAMLWGK
ncbi:MAG: enoyl-[acyl-carrier-protein] reductase FabK [Filifactoraceae bacterium]